MKKPLKDFSLTDYSDLKSSGMFWELYPEATGDYLKDCSNFHHPTISTVPISLGTDEIYSEWFICLYCDGTRILKDYKFCPDCGEKISWS